MAAIVGAIGEAILPEAIGAVEGLGKEVVGGAVNAVGGLLGGKGGHRPAVGMCTSLRFDVAATD